MAISLVQHGKNLSGTSSVTVTLSVATTAGSLLVAYLASDFSSTETFTPPSGWALAKSFGNGPDGDTTAVYYLANCPGGTTSFAFSRSGTAFDFKVFVAEFSGIATTSPLDQTNAAGGTASATVAAGSITTTQASELLFMGGNEAINGGTFTAGSGLTLGDSDTTSQTSQAWQYQILTTTGTYSPTMSYNSSNQQSGIQVSFKGAGGGGPVNGSATLLSLGAILGGIAGQAALPRGIAAGPTLGGGIAASSTLPGGLAASAGAGGGLSGQGNTTAASAATPSDTLTGTGAVGDGMGAGNASVSPSSAATPSDTLTGTAGFGGGLAGAGTASTGFAGGFAGLTTGLAGFAGFVSGLAGRALVAATGTISGVANATATILAAAGFLGGFGGAGSTTGSSTALSSATAQGTGSVGGGLAGMAAVLSSSLASALAALAGTAGVGTGQSGSASTTARSAATPSLTFLGQGALGGLFAAGQAAISATANLLRLAPFSFVAALKQFLSFAFTAKPTLVFGSTLAQKLSFAFTRSPALATPNSTIQVTVTATDINGNPVASLATCTCTVTFPDGTSSSFSLTSGITNAGSGKYTLVYQTKGPGECLEDWKGTDSTGNTCEFHNITPVSF